MLITWIYGEIMNMFIWKKVDRKEMVRTVNYDLNAIIKCIIKKKWESMVTFSMYLAEKTKHSIRYQIKENQCHIICLQITSQKNIHQNIKTITKKHCI